MRPSLKTAMRFGHRERFLLVVRHVDERDADVPLDRLQLHLHLLAELQVERAERLVEKEDARLVHDRPGERDALALASRELGGLASAQVAEADHLQRLLRPCGPLRLLDLRDPQAVLDVLGDGHVREQRVVLKDGVDGSVVSGELSDVLAADLDRARVRNVEAGDHPEGRRLPRPRRSEHGEELAAADLEVHVVHRDDVSVAASYTGQADVRHIAHIGRRYLFRRRGRFEGLAKIAVRRSDSQAMARTRAAVTAAAPTASRIDLRLTA